jgi:hypothetical protein
LNLSEYIVKIIVRLTALFKVSLTVLKRLTGATGTNISTPMIDTVVAVPHFIKVKVKGSGRYEGKKFLIEILLRHGHLMSFIVGDCDRSTVTRYYFIFHSFKFE